MTKVKKFEDVMAWQRSRELVRRTYDITSEGEFSKDFSLRGQIRRAGVSVMSNIAEGLSRQTDKEFVQFLYIAKGSVSEVQSQLYVAQDLGYIGIREFDRVYELASEVAKLITGFIRYLQGDSAND